MRSEDYETSHWERRIAALYGTAPVPLDGIRNQVIARSSLSTAPSRSRRSRLALEVAIALAVCIVLGSVIALPRLLGLRSNFPGGRSITPPAAGSPQSLTSSTCVLPVAILRANAPTIDVFLRVSTSGSAAPVTVAGSGDAYARGLAEWVPASAGEVAPNGAEYAYVNVDTTGSTLHFVDQHQDHVIASSSGPIQILGFVSQQMLAYTAPDAAARLSTWLLDTAALQARVVSRDHLYQWAGGDALWRIGPAAQGSGIALYRLDLRTDAEMLWFDVAGYLGAEPAQSPPLTSEGGDHTAQDSLHHNFAILGFDDSGHPIVQLGSAGPSAFSAVLLLTGQDAVQTLVVPGANGPGHLDAESASGGRSAVWLVDPGGQVAVYGAHGPLHVIARLAVPPGGKAEVAGPCE